MRVLLVEDEFLIAVDIEQMLVSAGCIVVGPVPTVSRALALLDDEDIDFAILDVNLGRERSAPVADALRARSIPFALATGYDDGELPEQGYRGVPHLGKPLDRRRLGEVLHQVRKGSDRDSAAEGVNASAGSAVVAG